MERDESSLMTSSEDKRGSCLSKRGMGWKLVLDSFLVNNFKYYAVVGSD